MKYFEPCLNIFRIQCEQLTHLAMNLRSYMVLRGGVEDTRLEAKAKDTKISEAKDSLSEDRHSRGQGQGPRTQAQVLFKKKKRSSQKIFQAISKKKVFTKIFHAISTKKRFPKNFTSAPRNFNNSKSSVVLKPRTGQFLRT